MNAHAKGVFAVALLAGVLAFGTNPRLQTPAPIGTAPLTHLAFVVSDIDAAAAKWADVLGMPVPNSTQFDSGLPDGTKTAFKFAFLNLTNFQIELDQPVDPKGFVYEQLQKFGSPSVHHIGFGVKNAVDDVRADLQAKGGKWVGGPNTAARVAFVDLRDQIGASIELVQMPNTPAPRRVAATMTPALGSFPVVHVGWAVRNADQVVDNFSKILGTIAPTINLLKTLQYPPTSVAPWNPKSGVKLGSWKQENNVDIEILEPVKGPSPWTDTLDKDKQHSSVVVQHVAFDVGDKLDEIVKQLQAKGGKWTHGAANSRFAYVDFTPTLGIVFGILGTRPEAAR